MFIKLKDNLIIGYQDVNYCSSYEDYSSGLDYTVYKIVGKNAVATDGGEYWYNGELIIQEFIEFAIGKRSVIIAAITDTDEADFDELDVESKSILLGL